MKVNSTFKQRAALCKSNLGARLFNLCEEKKTNLALSADVTSADELLRLADLVGSEICILKTHIDIIHDFNPALTSELRKIAKHHQFLIFEDRKFADIGNTVKQQFAGGIYQIAAWADIINAHTLPGPGVIEGLLAGWKETKRAQEEDACGLLLIAEMSSKGHLLDPAYSAKTLELARKYPEFVFGFITQHALDANFMNITPGVQLEEVHGGGSGDGLGQQYNTPKMAVLNHGSDVIIVGRGIYASKNPRERAQLYRQHAWEAYTARLQP